MPFAFPVIVLPHVMTEVGDDLVNFAAAGGVTTAVCVIAGILRRRRAAAAAAGVVAGGELFEHDLAISAISTVNASLTPSEIRRRV